VPSCCDRWMRKGNVDSICALNEYVLIRFISDGTSWNSVDEGECLPTLNEVSTTNHCNIVH